MCFRIASLPDGLNPRLGACLFHPAELSLVCYLFELAALCSGRCGRAAAHGAGKPARGGDQHERAVEPVAQVGTAGGLLQRLAVDWSVVIKARATLCEEGLILCLLRMMGSPLSGFSLARPQCVHLQAAEQDGGQLRRHPHPYCPPAPGGPGRCKSLLRCRLRCLPLPCCPVPFLKPG